MTRWTRLGGVLAWLGAVTVSVLLTPAPADAQPRRWEIEFHVGDGPVSDLPDDGSVSLPPAGPPFTTVVGTPSRRASSFYFGDGALLLNQVNAALGLVPAIVPLDPLLQGFLFERERGASLGFRLSRAITGRFGVEFSLDYERGRLSLPPSVVTGVEATRASFVPVLGALIGTGPFEAPTVTSSSSLEEKTVSQVLTTGALTVNLLTSGRAIPYLTAGAGFAAHTGGMPRASLEGSYRFQALGSIPVHETDTVALRTEINEGAVGVFGGGFKFSLSRRWGVRFDVRAFVNEVSIVTMLDAHSSTAASSTTSAGAAASLSEPSLQFSNNSALGLSSLSSQPLNGFRTFEASGWQSRTIVSGGAFLRF
jgi:hypothetical protein